MYLRLEQFMKSKIVIENKTVVTFTGHEIDVNFARAWWKKKGLNPKEFYIWNENPKTKITSNLRFTMQ